MLAACVFVLLMLELFYLTFEVQQSSVAGNRAMGTLCVTYKSLVLF